MFQQQSMIKPVKKLVKYSEKMEEMVHGQEDFVITDSEFAFGWHFFIVSVSREMVIKLADMMGEQFNKYKGKGLDKKFISLLSEKMDGKDLKIKFAIKEEMESSKFGIF